MVMLTMKLTHQRNTTNFVRRNWKPQSSVADYEQTDADNFTRSVLKRFEPESSLGRAVKGLKNSSFNSFHKAVGFGFGAFWLGVGATVAGLAGSALVAAGLGIAGVGAAAVAVKNALDTGTDYVGYRTVDKAVGGRFRGDKQSAEAFGFAGALVGGLVASSLGAPIVLGAIPGAVVAGAVGYHYVGEILKDMRGN